MSALVVVLANQKGGVGKTTTTVNLARAAHLRGLRTLIVDLDPQANTTSTVLGGDPDAGSETVADVLSARSPATVDEVVAHTGWDKVDILPSGGDVLADVAVEMVAMGPGRDHRLRKALTPARDAYELVLIDSPPALDLLTINGLAAADAVVVVTTAALFSADGIARLLRTVDLVREFDNPSLRVAGMIVNQFEGRTKRQAHWMAQLVEHGPAPVWQPAVQKATWIAEALEAGVGLDEWGTPAATALAATYDRYLAAVLAAVR